MYFVTSHDSPDEYPVHEAELELDPHHHPFAFYKRSGKLWTQEECDTIALYTQDETYARPNNHQPYLYHDGTTDSTRYYPWADQDYRRLDQCTKVAYEDIFEQPAQIQQIKETPMPTQIEILLATLLSGAIDSPSDLEKRTKFTVVVYDASGAYNSTAYFTEKEAATEAINKFLQTPKGLGCTCVIHKEIKAFTTSIPVVEVK